MKYLPPLVLKDRYYAAIEKEIDRIFRELIYKPLLIILGTRMTELQNAGNPLFDAVNMGMVWYEGGNFRGKFSARISRELKRIGAVFDARSRTWALDAARVPVDIKFAIAAANSRFRAMQAKIVDTLGSVDVARVDTISDAPALYGKTIQYMEGDLQKNVSAASAIAIEAKLTDAMKDRIAKEWGENLNKYIKGWTEENVLKLRQDIQPHVLAGGRAGGLVKAIQDNYGVATRKAKFLARQETALLMSKYQEGRYRDMGVRRYRWSTSHDERVRKDHKALNGQIFSFDAPPITDSRTGARNNAGEDFNCRCLAIPVFDDD